MELAGGFVTTIWLKWNETTKQNVVYSDSGFDIRWATQKKQSDGSIMYESKREKRIDPIAKMFATSKSSKNKEAYYLAGKGLVAVDGTLIKKTQAPKREPTEAEKEELTYRI